MRRSDTLDRRSFLQYAAGAAGAAGAATVARVVRA
jgi:hypothetical protein